MTSTMSPHRSTKAKAQLEVIKLNQAQEEQRILMEARIEAENQRRRAMEEAEQRRREAKLERQKAVQAELRKLMQEELEETERRRREEKHRREEAERKLADEIAERKRADEQRERQLQKEMEEHMRRQRYEEKKRAHMDMKQRFEAKKEDEPELRPVPRRACSRNPMRDRFENMSKFAKMEEEFVKASILATKKSKANAKVCKRMIEKSAQKLARALSKELSGRNDPQLTEAIAKEMRRTVSKGLFSSKLVMNRARSIDNIKARSRSREAIADKTRLHRSGSIRLKKSSSVQNFKKKRKSNDDKSCVERRRPVTTAEMQNYLISQVLYDGRENVKASAVRSKALKELLEDDEDTQEREEEEQRRREKFFDEYKNDMERYLDLFSGDDASRKDEKSSKFGKRVAIAHKPLISIHSIKDKFENASLRVTNKLRQAASPTVGKLDVENIFQNEERSVEKGREVKKEYIPVVIDSAAFARTMSKFEEYKQEEEERERKMHEMQERAKAKKEKREKYQLAKAKKEREAAQVRDRRDQLLKKIQDEISRVRGAPERFEITPMEPACFTPPEKAIDVVGESTIEDPEETLRQGFQDSVKALLELVEDNEPSSKRNDTLGQAKNGKRPYVETALSVKNAKATLLELFQGKEEKKSTSAADNGRDKNIPNDAVKQLRESLFANVDADGDKKQEKPPPSNPNFVAKKLHDFKKKIDKAQKNQMESQEMLAPPQKRKTIILFNEGNTIEDGLKALKDKSKNKTWSYQRQNACVQWTPNQSQAPPSAQVGDMKEEVRLNNEDAKMSGPPQTNLDERKDEEFESFMNEIKSMLDSTSRSRGDFETLTIDSDRTESLQSSADPAVMNQSNSLKQQLLTSWQVQQRKLKLEEEFNKDQGTNPAPQANSRTAKKILSPAEVFAIDKRDENKKEKAQNVSKLDKNTIRKLFDRYRSESSKPLPNNSDKEKAQRKDAVTPRKEPVKETQGRRNDNTLGSTKVVIEKKKAEKVQTNLGHCKDPEEKKKAILAKYGLKPRYGTERRNQEGSELEDLDTIPSHILKDDLLYRKYMREQLESIDGEFRLSPDPESEVESEQHNNTHSFSYASGRKTRSEADLTLIPGTAQYIKRRFEVRELASLGSNSGVASSMSSSKKNLCSKMKSYWEQQLSPKVRKPEQVVCADRPKVKKTGNVNTAVKSFLKSGVAATDLVKQHFDRFTSNNKRAMSLQNLATIPRTTQQQGYSSEDKGQCHQHSLCTTSRGREKGLGNNSSGGLARQIIALLESGRISAEEAERWCLDDVDTGLKQSASPDENDQCRPRSSSGIEKQQQQGRGQQRKDDKEKFYSGESVTSTRRKLVYLFEDGKPVEKISYPKVTSGNVTNLQEKLISQGDKFKEQSATSRHLQGSASTGQIQGLKEALSAQFISSADKKAPAYPFHIQSGGSVAAKREKLLEQREEKSIECPTRIKRRSFPLTQQSGEGTSKGSIGRRFQPPSGTAGENVSCLRESLKRSADSPENLVVISTSKESSSCRGDFTAIHDRMLQLHSASPTPIKNLSIAGSGDHVCCLREDLVQSLLETKVEIGQGKGGPNCAVLRELLQQQMAPQSRVHQNFPPAALPQSGGDHVCCLREALLRSFTNDAAIDYRTQAPSSERSSTTREHLQRLMAPRSAVHRQQPLAASRSKENVSSLRDTLARSLLSESLSHNAEQHQSQDDRENLSARRETLQRLLASQTPVQRAPLAASKCGDNVSSLREALCRSLEASSSVSHPERNQANGGNFCLTRETLQRRMAPQNATQLRSVPPLPKNQGVVSSLRDKLGNDAYFCGHEASQNPSVEAIAGDIASGNVSDLRQKLSKLWDDPVKDGSGQKSSPFAASGESSSVAGLRQQLERAFSKEEDEGKSSHSVGLVKSASCSQVGRIKELQQQLSDPQFNDVHVTEQKRFPVHTNSRLFRELCDAIQYPDYSHHDRIQGEIPKPSSQTISHLRDRLFNFDGDSKTPARPLPGSKSCSSLRKSLEDNLFGRSVNEPSSLLREEEVFQSDTVTNMKSFFDAYYSGKASNNKESGNEVISSREKTRALADLITRLDAAEFCCEEGKSRSNRIGKLNRTLNLGENNSNAAEEMVWQRKLDLSQELEAVRLARRGTQTVSSIGERLFKASSQEEFDTDYQHHQRSGNFHRIHSLLSGADESSSQYHNQRQLQSELEALRGRVRSTLRKIEHGCSEIDRSVLEEELEAVKVARQRCREVFMMDGGCSESRRLTERERVQNELRALRESRRNSSLNKINFGRSGNPGLQRSSSAPKLELDNGTLDELKASNEAVRAMFESNAPKYKFGGSGENLLSSCDDDANPPMRQRQRPRGRKKKKEERAWVATTIQKYFDVIVEEEEEEEEQKEITKSSENKDDSDEDGVFYPDSSDDDEERDMPREDFRSTSNIRGILSQVLNKVSTDIGESKEMLVDTFKQRLGSQISVNDEEEADLRAASRNFPLSHN